MLDFSYADIERVCTDAIKNCILNLLPQVDNEIFSKVVLEQQQRIKLYQEKSE